jgi:hypothetical protein
MTSLAAPLTTTTRPARSARPRGALWARLVQGLTGAERHHPALRAGTERPAAPMLMSISLGGPAHLR